MVIPSGVSDHPPTNHHSKVLAIQQCFLYLLVLYFLGPIPVIPTFMGIAGLERFWSTMDLLNSFLIATMICKSKEALYHFLWSISDWLFWELLVQRASYLALSIPEGYVYAGWPTPCRLTKWNFSRHPKWNIFWTQSDAELMLPKCFRLPTCRKFKYTY